MVQKGPKCVPALRPGDSPPDFPTHINYVSTAFFFHLASRHDHGNTEITQTRAQHEQQMSQRVAHTERLTRPWAGEHRNNTDTSTTRATNVSTRRAHRTSNTALGRSRPLPTLCAQPMAHRAVARPRLLRISRRCLGGQRVRLRIRVEVVRFEGSECLAERIRVRTTQLFGPCTLDRCGGGEGEVSAHDLGGALGDGAVVDRVLDVGGDDLVRVGVGVRD